MSTIFKERLSIAPGMPQELKEILTGAREDIKGRILSVIEELEGKATVKEIMCKYYFLYSSYIKRISVYYNLNKLIRDGIVFKKGKWYVLVEKENKI